MTIKPASLWGALVAMACINIKIPLMWNIFSELGERGVTSCPIFFSRSMPGLILDKLQKCCFVDVNVCTHNT